MKILRNVFLAWMILVAYVSVSIAGETVGVILCLVVWTVSGYFAYLIEIAIVRRRGVDPFTGETFEEQRRKREFARSLEEGSEQERQTKL